VSVFVATAADAARNAQAPTGSGSSTRPVMVDTKMERRVQAWVVMPTGMGTRKRSARPTDIERMRGMGLAPRGAGDG